MIHVLCILSYLVLTRCSIGGSEWTSWDSWTKCSVSCGTGQQTRTRQCQPMSDNTTMCDEQNNTSSNDSRRCHAKQCPTMGGWSMWGPWDDCTVTCGGGKRIRSRNCSALILKRLRRCTGSAFQPTDCNNIRCPDKVYTTSPPASTSISPITVTPAHDTDPDTLVHHDKGMEMLTILSTVILMVVLIGIVIGAVKSYMDTALKTDIDDDVNYEHYEFPE